MDIDFKRVLLEFTAVAFMRWDSDKVAEDFTVACRRNNVSAEDFITLTEEMLGVAMALAEEQAVRRAEIEAQVAKATGKVQ